MTGCTESILPWGFQACFDQGLLSCKLKCYCGRVWRGRIAGNI